MHRRGEGAQGSIDCGTNCRVPTREREREFTTIIHPINPHLPNVSLFLPIKHRSNLARPDKPPFRPSFMKQFTPQFFFNIPSFSSNLTPLEKEIVVYSSFPRHYHPIFSNELPNLNIHSMSPPPIISLSPLTVCPPSSSPPCSREKTLQLSIIATAHSPLLHKILTTPPHSPLSTKVHHM